MSCKNRAMIIGAVVVVITLVVGYVYVSDRAEPKTTAPAASVTDEAAALTDEDLTPPDIAPTPQPLTYDIGELPVDVSVTTDEIGYTAAGLKEMAASCGTNRDETRFEDVVAKLAGASMTTYRFSYVGDSQSPNAFVVSLMPNRLGYASLEEFRADFDLCDAGGDAYPLMMNEHWLLFGSACGTGFDDGSGLVNGCDVVRSAVEPTLRLN